MTPERHSTLLLIPARAGLAAPTLRDIQFGLESLLLERIDILAAEFLAEIGPDSAIVRVSYSPRELA